MPHVKPIVSYIGKGHVSLCYWRALS